MCGVRVPVQNGRWVPVVPTPRAVCPSLLACCTTRKHSRPWCPPAWLWGHRDLSCSTGTCRHAGMRWWWWLVLWQWQWWWWRRRQRWGWRWWRRRQRWRWRWGVLTAALVSPPLLLLLLLHRHHHHHHHHRYQHVGPPPALSPVLLRRSGDYWRVRASSKTSYTRPPALVYGDDNGASSTAAVPLLGGVLAVGANGVVFRNTVRGHGRCVCVCMWGGGQLRAAASL